MARRSDNASAFSALRTHDFALLWGGQTVSALGDGIFTVALAIVTLEVDRHPSGIALVFAARAIPSILFALVGGVVVDRVSRRLVLFWSDSLRGATVGVTALLLARGELRLWELIVMAAIFGAADSFFGPAATSIVPEILPTDQLISGNALRTLSSQFSRGLVGPALGGIVVGALSAAGSFALDAASFVVSAVCVTLLRTPHHRVQRSQSALNDAREGFRFVWERHWLLFSIVGAALANFVGMTPLGILLPLFVRETLRASAFDLGLVFAAGGASGVVASLLVARLGQPRHFVSVLWWAYAASGVGIALVALAPNVPIATLSVSAEVGLMTYGDVQWFAMMQRHVPHDILGRVASLIYLFAFSLGPLGILAGGVGASTLGIRPTILLCGALSTLVCVATLYAPGVRDLERPVAPRLNTTPDDTVAGGLYHPPGEQPF